MNKLIICLHFYKYFVQLRGEGEKMEKIKMMLDPEMILNKEFNVDFKGYNVAEVDFFLDQVMQDYMTFGQLMDDVQSAMNQLELENKQLKLELVQLQSQNELLSESLTMKQESTVTNVDLIRRVSLLEKAVFGERK